MDSIAAAQPATLLAQDPEKIRTNDVDEEDAVRKVEAATTPDHNAQKGVRNVEAVTLAWTKTSLACAFVWLVQSPSEDVVADFR
jgi:hypothetical protein